MKSDLHPPETGPGSDPVLYGVAAALAALFPPVERREGEPEAEVREAAEDADRA